MVRPCKYFSKIKKTWLLTLCLSITASTLSGCWDKKELNDIGLVSGSSFDWVDGKWKVTYQVNNPSFSSGSGGSSDGGISPPFLTFTIRGSTIFDAVTNSNLTSTRQLFFAHSRMAIISDRLARNGIGQLLDLFIRRPDARETIFAFVTERNPEELLDHLLQTAKNQGAGVEMLMHQEERLNSYYPGIRMYELTQALTSDSQCATVPELTLTGDEFIDRPDQTQVTDLPSRLSLGRLGVFKKDKLIGWLSQREGLGLNFLTGKVKSASIPFPAEPDQKKDNSSFSLLHSQTKVKPIWEKDHFVVDVDIKGTGTLLELGSNADLTHAETVSQLETSIEKRILKTIEVAWNAVQELNADVTEFAPYIHRKYPKMWKKIEQQKQWDAVFKKIELRPHVTIVIERFGLSRKSNRTVQEE